MTSLLLIGERVMSLRTAAFVSIISVFSNFAYGAQYVQSGTCGEAKILSGTTCANIEIQFVFDSCQFKSEPKRISDISCSDEKILARYTKSNFRYEAVIEKSKEKDKAVWKPAGPLTQFIQESAKVENKVASTEAKPEIKQEVKAEAKLDVKAEVKPDAKAVVDTKKVEAVEMKKPKKNKLSEQAGSPTAPKAVDHSGKAKSDDEKLAEAIKIVEAAKAAELEKQAKAEKDLKMKQEQEALKIAEAQRLAASVNPVKVTGFFDAKYSNFSITDDAATESGNNESGFLLDDGALYINYEKENVSAVIDIPFRRLKVGDTNSTSSTPGASSNGNVIFGAEKTQAYAKVKWMDGLSSWMGQFDGPIGLEGSDSKDRMFGKTAYLSDSMMPTTQVGFATEYTNKGFLVKAIAANSNNKGSNGNDARGDNNSEYALVLGFSNENFHTQIGGMSRSVAKANADGYASRQVYDLIVGGTVGKFGIDFEYAILRDPAKNTLTAGDNADTEKDGQGFMILPTYKVTDSSLIGLRYEQVTDDPGAAGFKTVQTYSVGYHYKYSENLEMRAEYVGYDFKKLDDTTAKATRSSVGAVLTF